MPADSFTTEPVTKLFFRYLLPSIGGTMVTSIYILADTIIIGKGIGIDAMAALNIVLPLFNIFFGTGLLFGVGGAVLMSIAKGRGDVETGHRYFSTAVILNAITSLIYMIIFIMFMEQIARFLGATDTTLPYVMEYAPYVLWGLGFFSFSTFLSVSCNIPDQKVFVSHFPHFSVFSPYSMSYSVHFLFSSFLSVSRHIPDPTVCISHFPLFSVFLAILKFLKWLFLIIPIFPCFLPYSRPTVCVSQFPFFFHFSHHIPGPTVSFLIFNVFEFFSPYYRSKSVC